MAEAKQEVYAQLFVIRRHCFVAKSQLKQVKIWKQNLRDDEAILHIDFAENFQIKQQDEIMAAHWVTKSVTIYTAVLNTKSRATSFALVSDDINHDKYSVAAFNRTILEKAMSSVPEKIEKLHIFSDGAVRSRIDARFLTF